MLLLLKVISNNFNYISIFLDQFFIETYICLYRSVFVFIFISVTNIVIHLTVTQISTITNNIFAIN